MNVLVRCFREDVINALYRYLLMHTHRAQMTPPRITEAVNSIHAQNNKRHM